jgi:hypothetical protein
MRRRFSLYILLLHFLVIGLAITCTSLSWMLVSANEKRVKAKEREQDLVRRYGGEVEFMHRTLLEHEVEIENLDDMMRVLERIFFQALSSKDISE